MIWDIGTLFGIGIIGSIVIGGGCLYIKDFVNWLKERKEEKSYDLIIKESQKELLGLLQR